MKLKDFRVTLAQELIGTSTNRKRIGQLAITTRVCQLHFPTKTSGKYNRCHYCYKNKHERCSHVGHVHFVYIVWPLWFWCLIGANSMLPRLCMWSARACVTCAHRPPNRHETSHPAAYLFSIPTCFYSKLALTMGESDHCHNQDFLQSAHTCNAAWASPATTSFYEVDLLPLLLAHSLLQDHHVMFLCAVARW